VKLTKRDRKNTGKGDRPATAEELKALEKGEELGRLGDIPTPPPRSNTGDRTDMDHYGPDN
jgi:hypothetical protein